MEKQEEKKEEEKKKKDSTDLQNINRFFAALERSSALKQCPRRSVLQ